MKKKPAKYWINKIKRLLASKAKTNKCAVCGVSPASYHHLLCKNRFVRYIGDPRVLIELCHSHHVFSSDLAPHSPSVVGVECFIEWMHLNRPEQYKWVEHARKINFKPDYENMYNTLKNFFDNGEKIDYSIKGIDAGEL